jgi:hypothetical protein
MFKSGDEEVFFSGFDFVMLGAWVVLRRRTETGADIGLAGG